MPNSPLEAMMNTIKNLGKTARKPPKPRVRKTPANKVHTYSSKVANSVVSNVLKKLKPKKPRPTPRVRTKAPVEETVKPKRAPPKPRVRKTQKNLSLNTEGLTNIIQKIKSETNSIRMNEPSTTNLSAISERFKQRLTQAFQEESAKIKKPKTLRMRKMEGTKIKGLALNSGLTMNPINRNLTAHRLAQKKKWESRQA